MKLDPEKLIKDAIELLKRNKGAFTNCDVKIKLVNDSHVQVIMRDLTDPKKRRTVTLTTYAMDTDPAT